MIIKVLQIIILLIVSVLFFVYRFDLLKDDKQNLNSTVSVVPDMPKDWNVQYSLSPSKNGKMTMYKTLLSINEASVSLDKIFIKNGWQKLSVKKNNFYIYTKHKVSCFVSLSSTKAHTLITLLSKLNKSNYHS